MSAQTDAITKQLETLVAKATKTLALEITANLIEATPVDTGWARANWVPSVGTPTEDVDGAPTPHGTPTTAGALQAAGQAAVLAYQVAQGDVWVSNNVPYINRLDLGTSTQAPAGFIESAIGVAVATIGQRFAGSLQLGDVAGLDLLGAGAIGANNLAGAYSPLGDD